MLPNSRIIFLLSSLIPSTFQPSACTVHMHDKLAFFIRRIRLVVQIDFLRQRVFRVFDLLNKSPDTASLSQATHQHFFKIDLLVNSPSSILCKIC